jgi:hypothetical protein
MGLNYNDIKCLLDWRGGRSGGAVATLGRQQIYLHDKQRSRLRDGLAGNAAALAWLDGCKMGDYADDMFRQVFGFERVESIDFSSYENATVVQDISAPLPPALVGQFDLAIDGGTLEHVFNYPAGVGNLIRLVRVGGAVYTQNPCNGMAGHGFYQLSPELLYRVFSPENGFQIDFVRTSVSKTFVVERTVNQPVYNVKDPVEIGERVMVPSRSPTLLMCMAHKIRDVEPFARPPLQSDYVPKWSGAGPELNWKGRIANAIPPIRWAFARAKNARAFTRAW